MNAFEPIEAEVILRYRGRFYPCDLYVTSEQALFVKYQTGFVRMYYDNRTSVPGLNWYNISENVVMRKGKYNYAYLERLEYDTSEEFRSL